MKDCLSLAAFRCRLRSGCSPEMFWRLIFCIFSCSLLVECLENVRVSPCENTAGRCVEHSQRASGRDDDNSKISQDEEEERYT